MMLVFAEQGWSFGMVAWGLIHLLSWGIAFLVVYVFAKDLFQQIRQGRKRRRAKPKPFSMFCVDPEPECEDIRRTP